MKREEEIRQSARDYADVARAYLLGDEMELVRNAYEAGAEWADTHSASPWHSVADGDLPTELKGDCVDMPFIVVCKDGSRYSAYYTLEEDEENCYFYDDCNCELDVEYWMEIPPLPKEREVKK